MTRWRTEDEGAGVARAPAAAAVGLGGRIRVQGGEEGGVGALPVAFPEGLLGPSPRRAVEEPRLKRENPWGAPFVQTLEAGGWSWVLVSRRGAYGAWLVRRHRPCLGTSPSITGCETNQTDVERSTRRTSETVCPCARESVRPDCWKYEVERPPDTHK